MSDPNTAQQTPQQRKRLALVFQLIGGLDIVLGVGVAFLFPKIIDDPSLDGVLMIMGGILALAGAAMWWWGRSRLTPQRSDDGSGGSR